MVRVELPPETPQPGMIFELRKDTECHAKGMRYLILRLQSSGAAYDLMVVHNAVESTLRKLPPLGLGCTMDASKWVEYMWLITQVDWAGAEARRAEAEERQSLQIFALD